jgi:hypothetical protein
MALITILELPPREAQQPDAPQSPHASLLSATTWAQPFSLMLATRPSSCAIFATSQGIHIKHIISPLIHKFNDEGRRLFRDFCTGLLRREAMLEVLEEWG